MEVSRSSTPTPTGRGPIDAPTGTTGGHRAVLIAALTDAVRAAMIAGDRVTAMIALEALTRLAAAE